MKEGQIDTPPLEVGEGACPPDVPLDLGSRLTHRFDESKIVPVSRGMAQPIGSGSDSPFPWLRGTIELPGRRS